MRLRHHFICGKPSFKPSRVHKPQFHLPLTFQCLWILSSAYGLVMSQEFIEKIRGLDLSNGDSNLHPKDPTNISRYDSIKLLERILDIAKEKNMDMQDVFNNLMEMVTIGLVRGNIRNDQIEKTADAGKERIKAIIKLWGIATRNNVNHKSKMTRETLTFARFISLFPHFASIILLKNPEKFNLKLPTEDLIRYPAGTYRLPIAMRHSGFAGLIPKTCIKAFRDLLEVCHLGFMVEFGRMINRNKIKQFVVAYDEQKTYMNAAIDGVVPEDKRVVFMYAFGLNSAENVKSMLTVCSNVSTVTNRSMSLTSESFNDYTDSDGSLRIVSDVNEHIACVAEAAKIVQGYKSQNNSVRSVQLGASSSGGSLI